MTAVKMPPEIDGLYTQLSADRRIYLQGRWVWSDANGEGERRIKMSLLADVLYRQIHDDKSINTCICIAQNIQSKISSKLQFKPQKGPAGKKLSRRRPQKNCG